MKGLPNSVISSLAASKAQGVAPQFTSKPAIRQLGSSVVFQVTLIAAPPPSITWYKGSSAITHGSHYNISIQTDGLNYILLCEIMDVGKSDGGAYKVTAKNAQGEANANINLNLEGKSACLREIDLIRLSCAYSIRIGSLRCI